LSMEGREKNPEEAGRSSRLGKVRVRKRLG